MRHAGPRSVAAVALRSAMTVLLVSVPHATTANPVSLAKWAVCELGPIARNYASDLQDKREKENVGVRLLMHNGDPRHNGCGFYFQVGLRGVSGHRVTGAWGGGAKWRKA